MSDESAALQLFRKSVLKQAKYRALDTMLPDPTGKRCLDLGSDNGVISYLLRRRGGRWMSADLARKAVTAIRDLVGSAVCQIEGECLPFAPQCFDLVVVVDMLEHVADDGALVAELWRVLAPGGELVVNVPHLKRLSLTRPIRNAVGLDDAWHGHLRPGYDLAGLERLFGDRFEIAGHRTYSKAFSELLDIALNWAYVRLKGDGRRETSKGTIVTSTDLAKFDRELRNLSRAYPLLSAFAKLDALLLPTRGHYLLARAYRR